MGFELNANFKKDSDMGRVNRRSSSNGNGVGEDGSSFARGRSITGVSR
ncbi:MAG: hypothetical protein AAF599_09535 [Bacteroidota bacterium]